MEAGRLISRHIFGFLFVTVFTLKYLRVCAERITCAGLFHANLLGQRMHRGMPEGWQRKRKARDPGTRRTVRAPGACSRFFPFAFQGRILQDYRRVGQAQRKMASLMSPQRPATAMRKSWKSSVTCGRSGREGISGAGITRYRHIGVIFSVVFFT